MTGIDYQCLAGLFAADDVAEVVHVADGELVDDHRISSVDIDGIGMLRVPCFPFRVEGVRSFVKRYYEI